MVTDAGFAGGSEIGFISNPPTHRTMTDEQWANFMAMKAELPVITKDATNPHFGSSYASFGSIMQAITPVLRKHDADFVHVVVDGKLSTALYMGGQVIATSSIALPKLDNPQKTGSCLTYFKRYNVVLILGLETEDDDDGASAAAPAAPAAAPQAAPQAAPAPTAGGPAPAGNKLVPYVCLNCGGFEHVIVKNTKGGDPAVWCKGPECRKEYGGYQYKVADAAEHNTAPPAPAPPDDLPF